MSYFKRKSFLLVTLVLFLASLGLHWHWGWHSFIAEEIEKGVDPKFSDFMLQWGRDVMENWQSEFLQTIWTVWGLYLLRCAGSPQSKEGEERIEKMLELILRKHYEDADKIIRDLETENPKD